MTRYQVQTAQDDTEGNTSPRWFPVVPDGTYDTRREAEDRVHKEMHAAGRFILIRIVELGGGVVLDANRHMLNEGDRVTVVFTVAAIDAGMVTVIRVGCPPLTVPAEDAAKVLATSPDRSGYAQTS